MPPRVAIPLPLSGNPEYVERSLPQYEHAVELAGGLPVRIPLDKAIGKVLELAGTCDAVLLPGASADVDPAKYGQPRHPKTAAPDNKRDKVDELLLDDAYQMRKPILGICYGLQILNVYRRGTLVQHIESSINHAAGRTVAVAHEVKIAEASRLADVLHSNRALVPVNSSHHQSAGNIGDDLRVVAHCPNDGVVEAIEGTAPNHFVVAVQWHPERSMEDKWSQSIFAALISAAR